MGRNGAGKSTLLRHAAGLMGPTRGSVHSSGRVALLLQNPTDYLVHETVAREASPAALAAVGLSPSELGRGTPATCPAVRSSGSRLRSCSEKTTRPRSSVSTSPPAAWTARSRRRWPSSWAALDAAVLVATHDPEFAAAFADRVILFADGRPLADGAVAEVLTGGAYFATETARILGGAGGALVPEDGVALLRAHGVAEVSA